MKETTSSHYPGPIPDSPPHNIHRELPCTLLHTARSTGECLAFPCTQHTHGVCCVQGRAPHTLLLTTRYTGETSCSLLLTARYTGACTCPLLHRLVPCALSGGMALTRCEFDVTALTGRALRVTHATAASHPAPPAQHRLHATLGTPSRYRLGSLGFTSLNY